MWPSCTRSPEAARSAGTQRSQSSGLEDVGFIDLALFSDVNLFVVDGVGIALPADQSDEPPVPGHKPEDDDEEKRRLTKRRRFGEAYEVLHRGLSLKPNSSMLHTNLAALYAEKKMFARAVSACERAIEIDPGNDSVVELLSVLRGKQANAGETAPFKERSNNGGGEISSPKDSM